jgi:hypothetical protein
MKIFFHRAIIVVQLVLLVSLGSGAPAFAAARTSDAQNRLYDLFDIKKVGARVVVAVDTSLSMKDSWPMVKKALNAFSRTLGPGDLLTVVVFDNNSRTVYEGPGGTGSKLKAALPRKPNPRGHRTDLGEGVATVIKELGDTGDRLPVVVFLTDGREDPPSESRFAARHNQSWSELKNEAQSDSAAKQAYVYGIGLNNKTDIDKLRQVWPEIQPLTVDPSELTTYLVGLKDKIRRERLRRELAKEFRNGRVLIGVEDTDWGAIKSGKTLKRTVTIKSTFKKLPIELNVSGASWGQFQSITKGRSLDGRLPRIQASSRRLVIKPGETKRYVVDVAVPRLKGRWGLKTEEKYRASLNLAASAQSRDAQTIDGMGVNPRVILDGRNQVVWFNRSIGQSVYLIAALALVAFGLTAVFWRRAVLPAGRMVYRRIFAPPLFGRLAFSGAPAGEQLPRPLSLEQFGRHTTLGTRGKVRLKGKEIQEEHAELFTQWAQGEPKMIIKQLNGAVRVSRSPGTAPTLVTEPTALKPGSVIQIGEYRIQWS